MDRAATEVAWALGRGWVGRCCILASLSETLLTLGRSIA